MEMVTQQEADSQGREKTPDVDVESAPPYVTISLQDEIEDSNSSSSELSKPIVKDNESDWGAWICVLGSLLFLITSAGFNASIGIVQSYFSLHQLKDNSVSEIGWIPGIYLFLSMAPSFLYGSLLDRYGPRVLSAVGGICSAATFALMAECKTYWQFMLCLGVFGSIGTGIKSTVAVGVVGKLFVRRRGLAIGTAVMGSSLGAIIFPLVLRSTFENLGFVCFLPFKRLAVFSSNKQDKVEKSGPAFYLSAWKNPSFASVSCGICLMEFVNCGIGSLLPAISTGAGFTAQDGYTLFAIMGGCSCISRLVMGLLSDRLGGINSMVGTLVLIVILMSAVLIPFSTTSAPLLYVFSALWGLMVGSFYALSPVIVGNTCEPKDYARYYGSTNFGVGLSLLIANPVSGIMLEKVGAKPLAFFYLGIVVLAGLSITVARGLLLSSFTTLRARI
ncbi:related to monocarboxylate transporter 2 [Fusarium oxysporum]|uniref:Related to monocarboxylate transporter 2 n=1 Tax=Fusarium oxysporum TaxID=5507 RepID=A0A2H3TCA6_FUSOX|nr:related to monocarboxylate transporter 2 [Fusarium oxysporum]